MASMCTQVRSLMGDSNHGSLNESDFGSFKDKDNYNKKDKDSVGKQDAMHTGLPSCRWRTRKCSA